MKYAYDLDTVHTTILQEKNNVYQLHSNNIHQLYTIRARDINTSDNSLSDLVRP
jgi:hypothetical protein